jgi:hypothetical protein
MGSKKQRNKCHCGSGLKYRKCHGKKMSDSELQGVILMAQQEFLRQQKQQEYLESKVIFVNYVNPVTHPDPSTGKKQKVWAIANKLYYKRPEHETFHDFIVSRLVDSFGPAWFKEQEHSLEKHFLYTAYQKHLEWRIKNAVDANRADDHTWLAKTDGWTKYIASLAFDLCSLEHGQFKLPDWLWSRLRNKDNYQGARYEVAVAGIFARLGCQITFLDTENNSTITHCEFIAKHIQSGVSMAVEAKSRHRHGVINMDGKPDTRKFSRADVHSLFNKALKKAPDNMPFLVFVDLNIPASPTIPFMEKQWVKDIKKMLGPAPTPENPSKFTGAFFTNYSPQYEKNNIAQPSEALSVLPISEHYKLPPQPFTNMLTTALANYGFVPDIREK